MVPRYTEISHFRRPYSNAVISGFGYGDTAVSTAPATPDAANPEAYIETDKRGYRFLKNQKDMLKGPLTLYAATEISTPGAPLTAKLTRFTPEQLQAANVDAQAKKFLEAYNAGAWMERQVAAGNVVLANAALAPLLGWGQPLIPGLDVVVAHKVGSQAAMDGAKMPVGMVVAGDPERTPGLFAMLGPVGMAAVAVVGVAGVVWIVKRKRRA